MSKTDLADLERDFQVEGRTFVLKVETSNESEDYAKYEALRNEIWGFPEDNLPGSRNMMCENFLHEGSSLFIALYDRGAARRAGGGGEILTGFSYGFVGLRDKSQGFRSPDNLWFYSQYTGVKEDFRSYGLGVKIKEFQADVLRRVFGIFVVTCTYDPLTAVNAHRNIRHFGMEVLDYRVATYGEYGGRLNRRDIPSDRFFMHWDLRAPCPRATAGARSISVPAASALDIEFETVLGRSGPVALEVVRPGRRDLTEEVLAVPVPGDFYRMLRETDVEEESVRRIPLDWRLRTRETFLALLGGGYRVVDFLRGKDPGPGFYVLRRPARGLGKSGPRARATSKPCASAWSSSSKPSIFSRAAPKNRRKWKPGKCSTRSATRRNSTTTFSRRRSTR